MVIHVVLLNCNYVNRRLSEHWVINVQVQQSKIAPLMTNKACPDNTAYKAFQVSVFLSPPPTLFQNSPFFFMYSLLRNNLEIPPTSLQAHLSSPTLPPLICISLTIYCPSPSSRLPRLCVLLLQQQKLAPSQSPHIGNPGLQRCEIPNSRFDLPFFSPLDPSWLST